MTYRSLIVAIVALCIIPAAATFGATVTVDIPKNSVVCDSTSFTAKINKIADSQVSVHISSNSTSPQSFVLKINGLQPGDQDVYINGAYKGKKLDSELVKGFAYSLPGRVVSPNLYSNISSVAGRLSAEADRIKDIQEADHERLMNTLRQAQQWAQTALSSDVWSRSVDVVVAPSDKALLVRSGSHTTTPEKAQSAFFNSCHLFQQARDRMFDNIKDPVLRNDAIVALTPVDLKFSYYTVNGKAKGTAIVVNNTNIAISGKVAPALPAGWKASAKTLDFKDLASGKSFKADFALVPPKSGGVPPESLRAQAAITLGYDPFWASLTLTAEAAKGATVQVPVVPKPAPKRVVSPGSSPASGGSPMPAADPLGVRRGD